MATRWLALDKPTRIPVQMFHAGLHVAGQDVGVDEAECFIAVMIYKGFVRGYISHEKRIVVVAATSAFPSLVQRPNPFA
jgi:COP9 signalosome complex subunit 12